MSDETYLPSPIAWIREQVETIDATGDTRSVSVMDRPVIMLTVRGVTTGALRKVPLMRVEHEGVYAAVASKGGQPQNPQWYANLRANPRVTLHDGTETWDVVAREIEGAERDTWWQRCVAAFPPYAEYQERTSRRIPVLVLERSDPPASAGSDGTLPVSPS
ncbi:MAG: nitroreductase family deazaflavin-dependent oxidoreductase [Dermatophilaceae bacterium]